MLYHTVSKQLWFDVERGCNTTYAEKLSSIHQLWFDVERGCNTTGIPEFSPCQQLWFDVERGCNTTYRVALRFAPELCFDVEGRSITFAAYKMKRSDVVVEACIIQP